MTNIFRSDKSIACVNGFVLKCIAVASMLTDHIGAVLFPYEMVFRYIGRIAFPVYIFLLIEGFYHTRSVRKYELRLLVFVFLSEIPFDLAFYGNCFEFQHQNMFFTLFLGLLMLDLINVTYSKSPWLEFFWLVVFAVAAWLLHTDYAAGGIVAVWCFYKFRNQQIVKYICLGVISLVVFGPIECFCLLAVIPLCLYNGQRGFREGGLYGQIKYSRGAKSAASVLVKYLFYIFYPAHLLVLHFISAGGLAR